MDTTSATATERITVQGQQASATEKSHLWVGDHFSFHDLIDAINPLQHIPIVGTIYRSITGDTIGNAARVVGDGIYGGMLGVVGGLLDVSVKEATGKDIGQTVMAMLEGDDTADAKTTDAKPADGQATNTDAKAAGVQPQTDPAKADVAAKPADVPVPQPKPAAPTPAAAPATETTAPVQTGIPLAKSQPTLMPLNNTPKLMALNTPQQGIPIDTSQEGLLALRAKAANNQRQVPLNIPPGTLAPSQRVPQTGAEFAQRMQEGLDKYKALMASREAAGAGSSVDQVQ